jgi:thioredoxin reductase
LEFNMTIKPEFDQSTDVAIIGGNFAGMSAAYYLLRARRQVVMFDDQQHRNRFAPHSHGLLGHDGMAPSDIKANGLAQLRHYPTLSYREERVLSVVQNDQGFVLTSAGGSVMARRLILATGQRDMLPNIQGLAECWGKTANTCPYCHGYELADQPTGILLDSSAQAGHYLRQVRRWAGSLTVFDNGATLAPETLAVMAELGHAHVAGPISAFIHDNGIVSAVQVAAQRYALTAFYLATKSEPAAPFAAQLGCDMLEGPKGPYVQVDTWQRSSVKGVYVAGDLASQMPAAIFAAVTGATAGLACDMNLAGLLE